uniref:Uncharacterized protein n=1 Tax=Parastrongyloides trichosuri TaxID=131310 RepID=A0A0N4ZLD3_PARTI
MRNTLEKEYIVRLNFHNETVWKIFYSKKPENLVELKSNESFRQFYKLIKKEMDIEFIDNIIFNIKKFGQSNKSNDLRHGIQKIEKKIKKTLIYSYDSCFANNSISIYYKQNKSEDCEDEIYILAFKRNILFESDNLERVISRYLAIYLCLKNYRPRNQTKNFYFSLLGFSNLDPDIISDKINVNEAGRTIIKCSNNLYMRFMSLQLL